MTNAAWLEDPTTRELMLVTLQGEVTSAKVWLHDGDPCQVRGEEWRVYVFPMHAPVPANGSEEVRSVPFFVVRAMGVDRDNAARVAERVWTEKRAMYVGNGD